MAQAELSLQDVADALGVHYMTAYRYVRLGLLPADKQGAVWVVQADDLDAFRAERAGRPKGRAGRGDGKWQERLEARLLAGDLNGTWEVLEAALASASDVDEVYLDIVVPALRSIGDRWAAEEIDVGVEHRASGIVTKLFGRLSARAARRGRPRGRFVVGAAPGERHGLPVTIVADVVRLRGYAVDDLGADVPAASMALACGRGEVPLAVGISATTPGLDDSVRAAVDAVRGATEAVPVLVGGAAVTGEDHARSLGADLYAADARGVIGLLDELRAAGSGRAMQ